MGSQDSPRGVPGDADGGVPKLKAEASHLEEAHTDPARDGQSQRVASLVSDHLLRPATIRSIEVHGAKNTRRGFLDPIFAPLTEQSRNADTTLGDVLEGLRDATSKLDRFDIFKPNPAVFLSDARQADPHAAATDLDIAVRVAEKSRFVFKAGTDVGNAEGSAYTHALWRNVLGGGEALAVNASAGTRTRSAYSAALSAPVRLGSAAGSDPDLRLALEGFASAAQKPWASHEEGTSGGSVRLAWRSAVGDTHSLAYSAAWRQLTGLAPSASPTVRADAGDSVKSALAHTFCRDRRDSPMLPQRGYLVRTTSELAGWGPLGGDVSFAKSELELSGAVPIDRNKTRTGISVGGGFRFGLLYPLPLGGFGSQTTPPSRINDRFQLGGPTDVRGFKTGGLGPHDGGDAVGGDVYAAGGVNMLLPLPRAGPDSPLRLQLFANGGRLTAVRSDRKDGVASALGDLVSGPPSLAAGVGLVYAHPVARFELNFSLPLILRRGEEGRKGLQVGVGINFL